MQLEYFGHSFWKVSGGGVTVAIDPFDDIGYPLPRDLEAQYVCVSHEHHDHNNVALIRGKPVVIREAGAHAHPRLEAELIPVFHDASRGSQRGKNNLIKLKLEGLTLVHCGDLGHLPEAAVLRKIARPDLLLIPVGEIYTLSLTDAWNLIDEIRPRLLFPMHYNTDAVNFRLGGLDAFLKRAEQVIRPETNRIEITPALLEAGGTVVLNWAAKERA